MNDVIVKRVFFKTQNDVIMFSYAMSGFPNKIKVTVKHGDKERDAKSILGLLSLNLSEPVDVIFESIDLLNPEVINMAIYPWELEE